MKKTLLILIAFIGLTIGINCANASTVSATYDYKPALMESVSNKLFVADATDIKYDNYERNKNKICGEDVKIPAIVPSIVSFIYTLIQIAVPIVLVILGSIDLFKGVAAGKEDEIKKSQQLFVKRLISAVLVFFVFVIVKLVIGFAAKDSTNVLDCLDCIINNDCESKKWTCSTTFYEKTTKSPLTVELDYTYNNSYSPLAVRVFEDGTELRISVIGWGAKDFRASKNYECPTADNYNFEYKYSNTSHTGITIYIKSKNRIN